jgi:quinone-modifying oxidoreductase, subunit QmoC
MGEDVHAVRRVRGLVPVRPALGAFAAEDLHDDPRRQVRCPRKLPITQIMHGLATYAHKLGLAPKMQPTRDFSLQFWANCTKTGRVNELKLTLGLYFKDGLVAGIKKGWSMRGTAFGLLKAGRLNPFELFGGHRCKDSKGIAAMLAKAQEIEQRNRAARG